MTAPPQIFQDLASYRPRHANIKVDLGYQFSVPSSLPQRPKNFNTFGKEALITLNTFNVVKAPNTVVYQYDLHFTGDATDYTKRVVLKKIFHSKAVKAALGEPANLWVWDGNKLAWYVIPSLSALEQLANNHQV
jgi:eukaryotic translation initiation factor 2C